MSNIDKYSVVISILCQYYKINQKEIKGIVKKKEKLYLIILLLNNFRCLKENNIRMQLGVDTDRKLNYKIKKAEEKILINRNFREEYFELEKEIKEKIENQ